MTEAWLNVDITHRRRSFLLEARWEMRDSALALFGPSGAGKTTLLHLIAGLLPPDRGHIHFRGRVFSNPGQFVPAHRRNFGVVFQEPRLFPHLNVRRNLTYGQPSHPRADAPSLPQVVDSLGIEDLLPRRPAQLSGGEARLVSLGRALLSGPQMLLMDEPFSGVDLGKKRQVLEFLRTLRRERSLPMLLVSHSMGEILELTSQVVVLERGQVLASGDFFEVLQAPNSISLADRLGIENLLHVDVEDHRPDQAVTGRLGDQQVLLPPAAEAAPGKGWVAVRPDDIILARQAIEGTSAQNRLQGTVQGISTHHGKFLVHVDVGQPLRVEVTERSVRELSLTVGAPVFCLIKTFSFRWRTIP